MRKRSYLKASFELADRPRARARSRFRSKSSERFRNRDKYRSKPRWHSKWWYVTVPIPSYEARDLPCLKIETNTYVVAVVEVETTNDSYSVTVVGTIGKPETLIIPIVFLQTVLDDDLGRFSILARSGSQAAWDIPGAKPVQLTH